MLTKTLTETATRVIQLADIVGQTTGTNPRHDLTTVVYPIINNAYRMTREHFVAKGFREFITDSGSLTGPAAPETGETYGVVDYPLTSLSLVGVDVLCRGEWEPLEEIDWESRRSVATQRPGTGRRPEFFSLRSFGTVATTTTTAGKVAFFPFVASQTYRLYTLNEWTDLTDGTHRFIWPSQAGFDLTTYQAVFEIAGLRDGDKAKRTELALLGIAQAKEAIGQYTPNVVQAGSKTIRRDASYRSGNRRGF